MGGTRSQRFDGLPPHPLITFRLTWELRLGLKRQQETYISQLRELQKSKPRGQVEENLTAEMTRLEGALSVARDELVCSIMLWPQLKGASNTMTSRARTSHG